MAARKKKKQSRIYYRCRVCHSNSQFHMLRWNEEVRDWVCDKLVGGSLCGGRVDRVEEEPDLLPSGLAVVLREG